VVAAGDAVCWARDSACSRQPHDFTTALAALRWIFTLICRLRGPGDAGPVVCSAAGNPRTEGGVGSSSDRGPLRWRPAVLATERLLVLLAVASGLLSRACGTGRRLQVLGGPWHRAGASACLGYAQLDHHHTAAQPGRAGSGTTGETRSLQAWRACSGTGLSAQQLGWSAQLGLVGSWPLCSAAASHTKPGKAGQNKELVLPALARLIGYERSGGWLDQTLSHTGPRYLPPCCPLLGVAPGGRWWQLLRLDQAALGAPLGGGLLGIGLLAAGVSDHRLAKAADREPRRRPANRQSTAAFFAPSSGCPRRCGWFRRARSTHLASPMPALF